MITIDVNTRKCNIPATDKIFGVYYDANSEIRHFSMPRYNKSGLDMALYSYRINYRNAKGEVYQYLVNDVDATDDTITFSWTIGRGATLYRGTIYFVICAVTSDGDGTVTSEWNTELASGTILEGIEVDQSQYEPIVEDVFEMLLKSFESKLEDIVDKEVRKVDTGVGEVPKNVPLFIKLDEESYDEQLATVTSNLYKLEQRVAELERIISGTIS